MSKTPRIAKPANASFGPQGKPGGLYRKPFWMPAISYYCLAFAIVIAVFFVVWWLLQDPTGGAPWIPAGILASMLLVGAVLLRETVLREARNRYMAISRRLESNLNQAMKNSVPRRPKLSIDKNSTILAEIEKRSSAARTLKELPDAHLEAFEICDEYLTLTGKELDSIGVGSPRLGAIRQGRKRAKKLHHYHLLSWAAVESGIYTKEAQDCDTIEEKVESAEKALTVLNTALEFYPSDERLLDSVEAVRELLFRTEVSHRVENAESAEMEGDYKSAIGSYKDALFYLARQEVETEEAKQIAEKINGQIEKLRDIAERYPSREGGQQ